MGHRVGLFVGPLTALRPFVFAAPGARVYALDAASPFAVLPLEEEVHEALHAAYATGDWLESGPLLTSTDLAFAARASRGSALAYVELGPDETGIGQCAMLWRDGAVAMKPATMDASASRVRPAALWPANIALKGLGVAARAGTDEIGTLGLVRFIASPRDAREIVLRP
jgi:hypothetical protein